MKGCPLAPYLYVLTAFALGYLLETVRVVGQIKGISLPDGFEMVNNHFTNDSLLSIGMDQSSVDDALSCLVNFCRAFGAIVSPHKTIFWLIGVDMPPTLDPSGLDIYPTSINCVIPWI